MEIKREQIELATAQLAGSTFVLDDEEDDGESPSSVAPILLSYIHGAEPLMIVVARKRKAQAEEATAQAEPKTRAKRGAKVKDAKQAAAVTVKTESDEVIVQSGTCRVV